MIIVSSEIHYIINISHSNTVIVAQCIVYLSLTPINYTFTRIYYQTNVCMCHINIYNFGKRHEVKQGFASLNKIKFPLGL